MFMVRVYAESAGGSLLNRARNAQRTKQTTTTRATPGGGVPAGQATRTPK